MFGTEVMESLGTNIDAGEQYHFKVDTETMVLHSNRPTLGHRTMPPGLVSKYSSILNSKSHVVSSAGDTAHMSICDEPKIMPGLTGRYLARTQKGWEVPAHCESRGIPGDIVLQTEERYRNQRNG